MQNLPALGTGPVSFVDSSTGNQFEIPLSLISFDSNNQPVIASSANTPAEYAGLEKTLLPTLVAQGLIFPGASTTTAP